MSEEFDHFVLTRFNTRLPGKGRASDVWLRHRLRYFESLCIESLRSQSVNGFRWLVYFDAERDEWFQQEVDRLSEGTFEPIWVEGEFIQEGTVNDITERASKPWVISTRVDNDDAVAVDFIAAIQSEFRERTEFVNFTSGLQLSDDGAVFYRSDPSNAFISLIEPRSGDLMGVYVAWHDRVGSFAPVRQVVTHPMWVQMVHGLNIGNAVRGVRANPSLLARHFKIGREARGVGRAALLYYQATSAGLLALRVLRRPQRVVWLVKVLWARTRLG